MVRMIACPACDTHAFANETHCRACGVVLRAPDGSVNRTATALLLGLTLTAGTAATACGDSTSSTGSGGAGQGGGGTGGFQMVSAYGVGPGGGDFSTTNTGGAPGTGGAGGAPGTGGAGGN